MAADFGPTFVGISIGGSGDEAGRSLEGADFLPPAFFFADLTEEAIIGELTGRGEVDFTGADLRATLLRPTAPFRAVDTGVATDEITVLSFLPLLFFAAKDCC